MRHILYAAGSALLLCGTLGAAPALAADTPAPNSVVGAATISVSPSEARTGQTVEISGACAPYPSATVTSVTSPAGRVTLNDTSPLHIRGRLSITAGPGTYPVHLVCSNGKADTSLKVDPAKPTPTPTPNPHHHTHGRPAGTAHPRHIAQAGGQQRSGAVSAHRAGAVPQGAPRTGVSAPDTGSKAGDLNMDLTLIGAGFLTALAGGTVALTARDSYRRRHQQ